MTGSGDGAADLALLVFRLTLAVVFVMHAWNHVFGGGRIPGTGRWFESLGMRPGVLHAWMASLAEFGAGVPPDVDWIKPLNHPDYDRLWAVCEDLVTGRVRAPRLEF